MPPKKHIRRVHARPPQIEIACVDSKVCSAEVQGDLELRGARVRVNTC